MEGMNLKRDLDFGFGSNSNGKEPDGSESAKKRKRKSRWGTEEEDKTFIPGMPTVLPSGLEKDQEELYLLQLQIEEVSRRLRTGDLGIPANPEERSPSPEPIYNNEGKRLNTREYRTRKKLEEQRHELIQRCCMLNTEYKPPSDYKPPIIKVTDKVMIPQEEHPDINFVGLLIGPRGNTLKHLEKDTGAKIIIRGKGSVKEGKIGRKDGQPLPGEDEPLHAYITANNPEHVKKAAEKIKDIIKEGIEVPEQQNDLRRHQLRELALLNGTLRENDGLMKLKQLQQAQTIITNTILCSKCGGTGHLSQDCKQARPSDTLRPMMDGDLPPGPGVDKAKMDSEYSALMAELGEGPPSSSGAGTATIATPRNSFSNRPNFSSPPPGAPPPMNAPRFNPNQPPPTNRTPLNLPPPTNTFQPPRHGGPPPNSSMPPQQMGAPPPMMSQPPPMGMPRPPPPMAPQSQPPSSLPWQQQQPPGMPPPPVTSQNMGMHPNPHNMGAPPPPPPPNSHNMPPWQQQQQQHSNYGMPQQQGPPPPWQHSPGPPPPMGNIPPWHQHHGPPPPPHMGGPPHHHMGGPPPPHMMPPPPPPGQNFNAAPPPPPPVQGGEGGLPAGIPLGVPPPPPPS